LKSNRCHFPVTLLCSLSANILKLLITLSTLTANIDLFSFPLPMEAQPTATTEFFKADRIEMQVGSGNVAIATSSTATGSDAGDIAVNASVAWSANTLTLSAYRNVSINAALNGTGTSALVLNPKSTGVGSGVINLGANITTGGSQTYNGNVVLANSNIGLTSTSAGVSITGGVSLGAGVGYQQIIKFLGGGSYSISTNGGTSYTTSTVGSSLTSISYGTLSYDGSAYSFTPSYTGSVDYLIVAGGGGAGNNYAAGGGAGGLLTGSTNITSGTSYSISVGDGGLGSASAGGTAGGDSLALGFTAKGGGSGMHGGNGGLGGSTGGSGGGASGNGNTNNNARSGFAALTLNPMQGNAGGDGGGRNGTGGGGGGAGGSF
jgi:hypothetical protein